MVILYGYARGVRSSRKLARACLEDVVFRVLCAGAEPDFRTIAAFRKRHLGAVADFFTQVLMLCRRAGLVKLGHVAIDGTKVKANASKHKAMSYGCMVEEEARLKAEIESMLAASEAEDAAEDERYGADKRGDELPEELAHRERRLKKIQEAKAALEAEARRTAARAAEEAGAAEPQRALPAPKAQRNFTDPESRIMLDGQKAFVQAYNAQLGVDSEHQIIVAEAEDVERTEWYDIEAFVAPERIRHREWREAAREAPRAEGAPPTDASAKERMRHKLRTERGRAEYDKRKVTVEPVFGQMKDGVGMRQFLLRGLENVRGEWRLACTAHNLLKLWRAYRAGVVTGAEGLPAVRRRRCLGRREGRRSHAAAPCGAAGVRLRPGICAGIRAGHQPGSSRRDHRGREYHYEDTLRVL